MTSIKELIKKESFDNIPLEFFKIKIHKGIMLNQKVIPVKALGEWAWKQLEFHMKNTWTYKNPVALNYAAKKGYTEEKLPKGLALKSAYHEIAVACLGENEIKKRLSEMK